MFLALRESILAFLRINNFIYCKNVWQTSIEKFRSEGWPYVDVTLADPFQRYTVPPYNIKFDYVAESFQHAPCIMKF